jgi:acyl dehydratase
VPELAIGDEIVGEVVTVEQQPMSIFTLLMRDPNPLHFDSAAVAAAGLGDRTVNQGTINMAYVLNDLLRLVASPELIRTFRCRFLGNVFGGDRVRPHARVTAVDGALVTLDVRLDRVDGDGVLAGTATIDVGAPA